MDKIKVFAPATVANLNCGFDILGLAIHEPGDIITLEKNSEAILRIKNIIGDEGRLPLDPKKNTASVAIQALLDALNLKQGFDISLEKQMPLGSGMGSSAASAVAGVYAANLLLGEPLTKTELLPFAMLGEKIACGAAHADNVAPSLFGGITLVRSYEPLSIVNLEYPKDLHLVVLHPHVEINTEDARAVLPNKFSIQDIIKQTGNLAGFISGLASNNENLIKDSLEDKLIEPYRSKLLPIFEESKKTALEAGALGFGISGSGPSTFSLCNNQDVASEVAKRLNNLFDASGVNHELYISKVNPKGPKVLSF